MEDQAGVGDGRCTRREVLIAGVAGTVLALGPRAGAETPPSGMALVPAGRFLMGSRREDVEALARKHGYHPSWFSGETPQRKVLVKAFYVDVYPVTYAEYARFCAASGYAPPKHWPGGAPPPDKLDHPVNYVNRADARAYSAWAGKRLPTEAEWEKAARGTDGWVYPWGDEFDPEACCWNRTGAEGTAPVSAHPRGASPYGVMDLVGNVAEWCDDGPGPGSAFIKGGCFLSREIVNLRPAARNMSGFDNNYSEFYGFRCVKEAG